MTDAQLIEDLRATFPGIWARPAAEYGRPEYQTGVWVGGEALMPDDFPVFSTLYVGEPEYDGTVHEGFLAWLRDRGYCLDCWDYGVYFAVRAD